MKKTTILLSFILALLLLISSLSTYATPLSTEMPLPVHNESHFEESVNTIDNMGQGHTQVQENDGRNYAVIIVGRYGGLLKDILPKRFQQYHTWYLNAASLLYTTLTTTYDYDEDDIFLFASVRDHLDIPSSFDPSWIDYPSTKTDIKQLFLRFKPGGEIWLTDEDTLLFCYIDHGNDDDSLNGKYAFNTFFGLPYDFENIRDMIRTLIFQKDQDHYRLYDWELGEYIENIHIKRMIFLLQPCHSGGFINELSGINHIICSSSEEDELATESWIEPFVKGLAGDADGNGDQQISILEAYECTARKIHERTDEEHPLIDDNDDGIGHHFTQTGYNPFNPNADGYLAARTYL